MEQKQRAQRRKGGTTTTVRIVADNIRALEAAYFSAMLEELRVFQVMDQLVELFQSGILPLGQGRAGLNLFNYWKESPQRISEGDRRNFYARAFGFPGGGAGTVPNGEFNDLWLRFVTSVSSFSRQNSADDLLRKEVAQQVRKSARDLAANLSLHGYGFAHFVAVELNRTIKDAVKILSEPEIKSAYGAQDMWQVINQVAKLELGGAVNLVRYRTMATSGATIISWLAKNTRKLTSDSTSPILRLKKLRKRPSRRGGVRLAGDPTDSDLLNACEQWLAVAGIPDEQIDELSRPKRR